VADSVNFDEVFGVIHLAGLAAVGKSFDEPELYLKANPGFQQNLFDALRKQNQQRMAASQDPHQPRFVIISSGSVYGTPASLPVNEQTPTNPSSPYAESKILQERQALESEFDCIVARPFNHIGFGQGEGFIVPDLAKRIITAKQTGATSIQVGNLQTKRDYTAVEDIAAAYRLLMESGQPNEIYNICSGVSHGGQEILDELKKLANMPNLEVKTAELRPSDVLDITGDNTKLKTATSWSPTHSFESSIEASYRYWEGRLAA
jgi:GDP-4-dehydro-6-deoxy-D-mannose reductase